MDRAQGPPVPKCPWPGHDAEHHQLWCSPQPHGGRGWGPPSSPTATSQPWSVSWGFLLPCSRQRSSYKPHHATMAPAECGELSRFCHCSAGGRMGRCPLPSPSSSPHPHHHLGCAGTTGTFLHLIPPWGATEGINIPVQGQPGLSRALAPSLLP